MPDANQNGTMLEAVTKDQLNTGLTGQIRYRVSERNLYAYLFGVKDPLAHVMGYFVAVLRERIANFEAPPVDPSLPIVEGTPDATIVTGISINDIRKNLRDLNEHMDSECLSSAARYGVVLDASLITGIDPPPEVESALAAINTAHNQVSSDISLAQASADQKIVQSQAGGRDRDPEGPGRGRAAGAAGRPAANELKRADPAALGTYLRNVRLALLRTSRHASSMEVKVMNFLAGGHGRLPGLLRPRAADRSSCCGCSASTPSCPSAAATSTCCSARCSP